MEKCTKCGKEDWSEQKAMVGIFLAGLLLGAFVGVAITLQF